MLPSTTTASPDFVAVLGYDIVAKVEDLSEKGERINPSEETQKGIETERIKYRMGAAKNFTFRVDEFDFFHAFFISQSRVAIENPPFLKRFGRNHSAGKGFETMHLRCAKGTMAIIDEYILLGLVHRTMIL